MKVYSIGREIGCDIIINDNSDVISRRHATLNVSSTGKMTIVDLSHNGTYVNGIRISPNVPFPVTRKDQVSFAHVARLDWNLVKNTNADIIRWTIIGLAIVLFVILAIWGAVKLISTPHETGSTPVPAAVDTTQIRKEKEEIVAREKFLQDSIRKNVQDSINKVRRQKIDKKKLERTKPVQKSTDKNKDGDVVSHRKRG